jgi:hypothetical protein
MGGLADAAVGAIGNVSSAAGFGLSPPLVPVDHDPFNGSGPQFVPVDHDPFGPRAACSGIQVCEDI